MCEVGGIDWNLDYERKEKFNSAARRSAGKQEKEIHVTL
jgi:hypothetical protein